MGCGSSSEKSDASSPSKRGARGVALKPKHASAKRAGTWRDRFQQVTVLGKGMSCRVLKVRSLENNGLFALKQLPTQPGNRKGDVASNKSGEMMKLLFDTEVKIIRQLNHPHCLELHDSWSEGNWHNILTALYDGGNLFHRVSNGEKFTEKTASRIIREIVTAVEYCHKHNIIHRDLKPENFVLESKDKNAKIRLIDFGCAKCVDDNEVVKDVSGTPYYVAPEVLNPQYKRTGKVWKASDMWSMGVITFILLCGYPPFNSRDQRQIFTKIKRGKYSWPQRNKLTDSAKDLISGLLQMNPSERFTAPEVLRHPWIVGDTATDTVLEGVANGVADFQHQCRLKKAVARVLYDNILEEDKEILQDLFKQFDKDGDGRLGASEISAMMQTIGRNEEDANQIMQSLDHDNDGGVCIDEFNAAHVSGILSSRTNIEDTFKMFDQNDDGFVTHKEIEKMCEFLTPGAAESMIRDVDGNSDGRIDFHEWLNAMNNVDMEKKAIAEE